MVSGHMKKLLEAKPFIIAEIGSNWTNFNEAKDSISNAKQCGADAVKFQAFDHKALYGFEAADQKKIVGQLSLEWLPKLKEKADACGIEFMCSAFSPDLYDAVDPYVNIHKIASSELSYPQLLAKVKSKGKPILLSVGASTKGDVSLALDILRGGPQIVLMYCSAAYPSREYNLFRMEDLKTSGLTVGLSDHSLDVIYPALSAVKHFGAIAIEKHVNFTTHKTGDSGHSLNADQFKLMCDYLRGARDHKDFQPCSEEKDMFLRHNRRLIAIQDIKTGSAFRFDVNFGSYRSLKDDAVGLSGFAWEQVAGNVATRDILAGEGIGPGDVGRR